MNLKNGDCAAMDWKEVVGQGFSILATLITFLSYQMNTRRSVLFTQTAATVSMCVGYFFLGATSGFALNVVGIVRNVTYYFTGKSRKASLIASAFFAAVMVVLGVLSWQAWYSLLIIVALAVNTVFLSLGDAQKLRKSILFTSTSIFLYNIFVFSIGGMANELVAIISSIIGIIRFRKNKNA
ncbi:MAG: YgjV family protein [Clostridia bacterium]|nr:YgjV family protein [Clostridia bacterium]